MVEKVRNRRSFFLGPKLTMRNQEGQHRRAEILSIRDTKGGRQFYCNFDNFNKRLDEWVPVSRIDFDREIEWPNPEKDKPKDAKGKKGTSQPSKKTVPPKKGQKRPSKREQSVPSEATTPHPWTGRHSARPRCEPNQSLNRSAHEHRRLGRIAGTDTERREWR